MSRHLAIVLAAGRGTRMDSELPKVLLEIHGRPMLLYVLDAIRSAGVAECLVVVGYRSDLVRQALADRSGIHFTEQTEQLGTGHAVMACREALSGHQGGVVIVAGDSPLTQATSLSTLLARYESERPAAVLGTAHKDDPTGLGRIVRDADGEFQAIVEQRDATDAQRRITEVNMSTYVFDCRALIGALDQLSANNAQGEYYITDCPGILKREGKRVLALPVLKACEALSINTLDELRAVELEMIRSRGTD
ncbi:MAG: NTP transferase domain-containing protein [Pirellulales bacterium]